MSNSAWNGPDIVNGIVYVGVDYYVANEGDRFRPDREKWIPPSDDQECGIWIEAEPGEHDPHAVYRYPMPQEAIDRRRRAATIADIEATVCRDILARQQLGIQKYGQTVAENPLPLREWLQHAYEETLDKAVYLRRTIAEIDRGGR